VTGDGTATGEVTSTALIRLAQEIRRLRKAANLSQPELAAMIGYTRQYVSMAERVGKNLPSRELVKAIDNALGANGSLIALRQRARERPQSHMSIVARSIIPW
jgi:transcriptional regulator with XRE-family HTH domain